MAFASRAAVAAEMVVPWSLSLAIEERAASKVQSKQAEVTEFLNKSTRYSITNDGVLQFSFEFGDGGSITLEEKLTEDEMAMIDAFIQQEVADKNFDTTVNSVLNINFYAAGKMIVNSADILLKFNVIKYWQMVITYNII